MQSRPEKELLKASFLNDFLLGQYSVKQEKHKKYLSENLSLRLVNSVKNAICNITRNC